MYEEIEFDKLVEEEAEKAVLWVLFAFVEKFWNEVQNTIYTMKMSKISRIFYGSIRLIL